MKYCIDWRDCLVGHICKKALKQDILDEAIVYGNKILIEYDKLECFEEKENE